MSTMQFWLALAGTVVPTAAVAITALMAARANREMRSESREAHAAISKRIAEVDERAERRAEAFERRAEAFERRTEAFERRMDAQQNVLQALAREVSFLAGRQAERDSGQPPTNPGAVR